MHLHLLGVEPFTALPCAPCCVLCQAVHPPGLYPDSQPPASHALTLPTPQVLHFWLSHSPNYDEVTRWYLGWKACFPAGLLDHERLRRQFNAALDMMNTAVDGHVMPPPGTAGSTAGAGAAAGGPASAYASRWATGEDMSGEAAQPPLPKPSAAAVGAGGSEPSLKELVQRFAEENSIQFMPKFGRYQDGLQVGGRAVVPCMPCALGSLADMVRVEAGDSTEVLAGLARVRGQCVQRTMGLLEQILTPVLPACAPPAALPSGLLLRFHQRCSGQHTQRHPGPHAGPLGTRHSGNSAAAGLAREKQMRVAVWLGGMAPCGRWAA